MNHPFELEAPRRQAPTIQLSALIDVVFILMIFVILGASFDRLRSMQIALPQSESADASEPGLLIEIPSSGPLRIDGDALPDGADLNALLRARRAKADSVTLRADRDTPLQRAIDVLDAARTAGFEAIDVVTRPKP